MTGISTLFGMSVPGATPINTAQRIHREALKALQYPDVQTAMARQGMEPAPGTPVEFAASIKREADTWSTLIRKTGIRVN